MKNNEKKDLAINWLNSLISLPQFRPFVDFNFNIFGCYDAQFIIRQPTMSLIDLRAEACSRRSFNFDWFICEMKKVFGQVSDYLFLNDPLQEVCVSGLNMISNFQRDFYQEINKRKIKVDEDRSSKKQVSLRKQLEMVFYLKNYEHDEQTVRKIGEVCKILGQNSHEYVLDLGKSDYWGDLIQRPNYD